MSSQAATAWSWSAIVSGSGTSAAIPQPLAALLCSMTTPTRLPAVMPATFAYPPGSSQPADFWTPWVVSPQGGVQSGARAIGGGVQAIARLRPDVSLDQAQAQMSQVAARIAADNPSTNNARRIGLRPLRDHLVGSSTRLWMLMLLAAVGIVLLIACANVANLWLARASVQQRDAAVRAALGASRARLAQRVLIESLVVSVAGTIVGLGVAWLSVPVLAAALPDSLARVATIGIDARVLALASVAALVTGLVSGIASGAARIESLALDRAHREHSWRRHEPRSSSRPWGACRRRGRAGRRAPRWRVALHRQLRQRDASRFRVPERPRADGVCSSAHESRIGAGRSPPGLCRHRRSRAAVARRHRRCRGIGHSPARESAYRCAAGARPADRLQQDREPQGRHRRLPPDAGDPPQERPVFH